MTELSTTEAKQAEQAAAARGGNSAFDVGYEQGFMAGIKDRDLERSPEMKPIREALK